MSSIVAPYHALRRLGRARGDRGHHPTILAANGYAGADLLPRDILALGVTAAMQDFLFLGDDAAVATWTAAVGTGLVTNGTGTDPELNQGSPLGQQGSAGSNSANDNSVVLSDNKHWVAASSATYDKSTEDQVIEAIVRIPPASVTSAVLVSKEAASTPNPGYTLFKNSATTVRGYVYDGSNTSEAVVTVSPDTWTHIIWFVNRTTGICRLYANSAVSIAHVNNSLSSITNAGVMNLGNYRTGTLKWQGAIACLSMWSGAAMLGSLAEANYTPVIATRFRQVRGLIAQLAKGDDEPTVDSRTSAAYLQRVESDGTRKLYQVGSNWGNVTEHPPGSTRAFIRIEPAVIAGAVASEDIGSWAAWNLTGTTVSADADTAPNGEVTADRVIEAATTDHHQRYDAAGIAGAIDKVMLVSVYVRNIDRRYAIAGMIETAGGHASYAIVDLLDGSVTKMIAVDVNGVASTARLGNPLTAYVDDLKGWYRIHVSVPTIISVNAAALVGLCNDGLTTAKWLGDPATYPGGISFWGAMLTDETITGFRRHGSYIPTTTSLVTKTADALRYEGLQNLGIDGNARRGRLSCEIWLPNAALGTDRYAYSLNDGGSANDRIEVFVDAATGKAKLQIASSEFGGLEIDLIGTTVLNDGAPNGHKLEAVWGYGRCLLVVDGKIEAQGAPSDIPDGLDRADFGADHSGVCLGAMYVTDIDGGLH